MSNHYFIHFLHKIKQQTTLKTLIKCNESIIVLIIYVTFDTDFFICSYILVRFIIKWKQSKNRIKFTRITKHRPTTKYWHSLRICSMHDSISPFPDWTLRISMLSIFRSIDAHSIFVSFFWNENRYSLFRSIHFLTVYIWTRFYKNKIRFS